MARTSGTSWPAPWREWSMGRKWVVGRLLTQRMVSGWPERASIKGARAEAGRPGAL